MNKKTLIIGYISVFITAMGFSVISPVIVYITEPLVSNSNTQTIVITLLTTVYALCVFICAPGLGKLSDYFGRKKILLICMIGSVIGYLLFGLATSLFILFLGRIIDGITGGSIAILFAYFADITSPQNRTKYFSYLSAVVGIGVVGAPLLSGILAQINYSLPFYLAAFLTLINLVLVYKYMPESLSSEKRLTKLQAKDFNPLIQLAILFKLKSISRLLSGALFVFLSAGSLQVLLPKIINDNFIVTTVQIGLLFSIIGFQDIFTQLLIMPRLSRLLNERQLLTTAISFQVLSYLAIIISLILSNYLVLILSMFLYGFGDSIFNPAFNSLSSKRVEESMQGSLQGAIQALSSLGRVIGPLIASVIYIKFGAVTLNVAIILILLLSIYIFSRVKLQSNKL